MASASRSEEKFRFRKEEYKMSEGFTSEGATSKIRHTENPQDFYLLLLESTGRYTEIFDELNRVYKQNEGNRTITPLSHVEVGDHCIFKSFSEYFLRGEVIAVKRRRQVEVDIIDVDAGELHQRIPIQQLFPVLNNSFFRRTPMLAPRCKLADIDPPDHSSWKEETVRRFLDMYGDRNLTAQFFGVEGDLYIVRLLTKNYEVNSHMVYNGMASTPREPENDSLPPHNIGVEVGDEVKVAVCYVQSPDSFFVQLEKNEDLISRISREMNREYSSSTSSYPFNGSIEKGQLCAVQYSVDQGWCRAEIVSRASPSIAEVKYVDYGNKDRVLIKNLRRLKSDFTRHPAQAFQCCLRGVRVLPVLSDRFVKLAEGQRMIIKIHEVKYEEHILTVTLFQMVNSLKYNINDYLAGKAEGPPEVARPQHGMAPCPYPDNEFDLESGEEGEAEEHQRPGPSWRDDRPSPRRGNSGFRHQHRGDFDRSNQHYR